MADLVLSQPWLDLEVFGVSEVGSWQLILDLGGLEDPVDLVGYSDKGYVLWLWWGVVWPALLLYKGLWSLWGLWLLASCLLA